MRSYNFHLIFTVLEKYNKSYKYKCFVQHFVYNLMVTICRSMYLSSHISINEIMQRNINILL